MKSWTIPLTGQGGFVEKDWKMEGGNVEVDQTPLQNQLKKNKECKFLGFDRSANQWS